MWPKPKVKPATNNCRMEHILPRPFTLADTISEHILWPVATDQGAHLTATCLLLWGVKYKLASFVPSRVRMMGLDFMLPALTCLGAELQMLSSAVIRHKNHSNSMGHCRRGLHRVCICQASLWKAKV